MVQFLQFMLACKSNALNLQLLFGEEELARSSLKLDILAAQSLVLLEDDQLFAACEDNILCNFDSQ